MNRDRRLSLCMRVDPTGCEASLRIDSNAQPGFLDIRTVALEASRTTPPARFPADRSGILGPNVLPGC